MPLSRNACSRERWAVLAATALLIRTLAAQEHAGPSPAGGQPDAEFRLQAAEQALAASRARTADLKAEADRLRAERDDLLRRLGQANARLTAVTRVATSAESEREELLRQAREDARRIRELERMVEELRAPPAPPEARTSTVRDLEQALAQRTREVVQLRARLAEIQGGGGRSAPGSAEPSGGEDRASAQERLHELNRLFDEEKKTLLAMQRLLDEQRETAEVERDEARRHAAELEARLKELERRDAGRATTAALESRVRELENRVRELEAALRHAEMRSDAFREALRAAQEHAQETSASAPQ